MGVSLNKSKQTLLSAVKKAGDLEAKNNRRVRSKPLPCAVSVEEMAPALEGTAPQNRPKKFEVVEVTSSKGKVYKLTVPSGYIGHVPKVWEWNPQRYSVADQIADGIAIREIARSEGMPTYLTIYAWLQHPEFREYVDGLVLETGMASKRERIAGMVRLTKKLFNKVMLELDGMPLTDKSIGPVLNAIPVLAKYLAQEKEEFVEQTNVQQQTTIGGTIMVAAVKVEDLLNSAPSEDQDRLKAQLKLMGDNVVNMLTSGTLPENEAPLPAEDKKGADSNESCS